MNTILKIQIALTVLVFTIAGALWAFNHIGGGGGATFTCKSGQTLNWRSNGIPDADGTQTIVWCTQ